MMSVASQVARIQPRIEISDLIGSAQIDELADDGPTPADLDWFAAQVATDLPEPVAGILSFPEWIQTQASYLRLLGSDAGDWLAAKIDGLAREVRFTHATTPHDHDERIEVMSRAPRNDALQAIESLKAAAAILSVGYWGETAYQVLTAANTIERTLRA